MLFRFTFVMLWTFSSIGQASEKKTVPQTAAQVDWQRLSKTRAVNMREILTEKKLLLADALKTPYALPQQELRRFSSTSPSVCALQFTSKKLDTYRLKTFPDAALAQEAGYRVTHMGTCGACSTLKDLYIYLTQPNLTTPVRSCASQWFATTSSLKKCLIEKVGFTSWCADIWVYNVQHSRKKCFDTCVAEYGWLNLLLRRFPKTNNTSTGALRPCVRCDEEKSGPGFKYGAGRTRRNSGIESGIQRPQQSISVVNHQGYFDEIE